MSYDTHLFGGKGRGGEGMIDSSEQMFLNRRACGRLLDTHEHNFTLFSFSEKNLKQKQKNGQ